MGTVYGSYYCRDQVYISVEHAIFSEAETYALDFTTLEVQSYEQTLTEVLEWEIPGFSLPKEKIRRFKGIKLCNVLFATLPACGSFIANLKIRKIIDFCRNSSKTYKAWQSNIRILRAETAGRIEDSPVEIPDFQTRIHELEESVVCEPDGIELCDMEDLREEEKRLVDLFREKCKCRQ
jgi:hypothetical protein